MQDPDISMLSLTAVDHSCCTRSQTSVQYNWRKLLSLQFIYSLTFDGKYFHSASPDSPRGAKKANLLKAEAKNESIISPIEICLLVMFWALLKMRENIPKIILFLWMSLE